MQCFLVILGKGEIIVTGLVKMSSSSLLLELLAAPAVQAALPSAGGKPGARQVRCLGCQWKTETKLFLQLGRFSFQWLVKS